MYSYRNFTDIPLEDRLWSCYLHACIKYVNDETVSNASLRKRFGLGEKSSATISRLIKEAIERKMIKPVDPNTAPKHMRYVPLWA